MKVFVTGASGWIGSAVVSELVGAGHEVLGLARSEASADAVRALGAQVHRGGLDDVGSLRAGAEASEGVVHLAYHHDFSQMEEAARLDRAAIEALGGALPAGAPFLFASGVVGLRSDGTPGQETDRPDPASHPRVANAELALGFADQGVRAAAVRFAPTVHGAGDHGFVQVLAQIARERGVAGYVDDGEARWAAVHRDDAATLVRLALERVEPGDVLHAVAEEGVRTRDIAEALGAALGLPVESVPAERAAEHFGWIGAFFGADLPTSNERTRSRFDWRPQGPSLLDDIRAGHYRGF